MDGEGASYGYIEELLKAVLRARLKSEPHARSGTRQDVFSSKHPRCETIQGKEA